MSAQQSPLEYILNSLVLISSLAIIIILSIDLFSNKELFSEQFTLNFHLAVCIIFLCDFFVRWYHSKSKFHFLWRNSIFLLVSIPYLSIFYYFWPSAFHTMWITLRLIPLIRGFYGITIIVSWMTRSLITNLFATYLTILLVTIYFCSVLFYFVEHEVNPLVKDYWNALNWALMNVTTVGSNIFGVTRIGQTLAVILAGAGMIFFPIFTAYVTTKFQSKRNNTTGKRLE